ncbi:MAG TPA: PilZ domain-containing protein [Gammaproteobacteria bacterium]
MGMDRRWGMRKPVSVDVVIDNLPSNLLRGHIGNISIGGLFVKTAPMPLRVNAPVELVLLLEDDDGTRVYRLPAVVVRLTPEGAGLMFDQYDVNAFRTLVVLLLEQQRISATANKRLARRAMANVSTEDDAESVDWVVEGTSELAAEAAAGAPALQQISSMYWRALD